MAHQLLLDFPQEDPGTLIILFCLRGRQVSRKLVKMNKNGSSNIFVGGVTRPEIRWCSAGNSWYAADRRRTKLLVFCHQNARPRPQVVKKPVELPVHLMVLRDLPVRLLDLLHHVDDLTQDSVESGDRIVR